MTLAIHDSNVISANIDLKSSKNDLVLHFQEVNNSEPQCFITENGDYTSFTLNFVPMIAETKSQIEKVKNILKMKAEKSKTKLDTNDI